MPTFIYPEGQNFDCGSCTKCCRSWHVHVDKNCHDRVTASPLFARLAAQNDHPPIYLEDEEDGGERHPRTQMKDGKCVFLEDNLCSIHREIGATAKPVACAQFPFILRPTPDGVYVGVSFYCSAVQANSGRPLRSHEPELKRILATQAFQTLGEQDIALDDARGIPWSLYASVEASMCEELRRTDDLAACMWQAMMHVQRFAAVLRLQRDAEPVTCFLRLGNVSVPRDEIFTRVERSFLVGMIGALESRQAADCEKNTAAIHGRGVLESETFGRPLDLAHFDDFRQRFDIRPSHVQFRRLAEQLLFRKFIARRNTMCVNAAAWYMALPLLEWYRDLSAFANQRLQPDPTDVHRAFDVVERSFSAHAQFMSPFLVEMARTLGRMLDVMPELLVTAEAPS